MGAVRYIVIGFFVLVFGMLMSGCALLLAPLLLAGAGSTSSSSYSSPCASNVNTGASSVKVLASLYGGPDDSSTPTDHGAFGHLFGQAAFAELSTNPGGPGKLDFAALGHLPPYTLLRVTNPQTGVTLVMEKLDVGAGNDTTFPKIDIWWQAAQVLGMLGNQDLVLSPAVKGDIPSLTPISVGVQPKTVTSTATTKKAPKKTTTDDIVVSCPLGTTNAIAAKVIQAARSQLNVPYVFDTEDPGVSFDCSGLTQWAYAQVGITIPRIAAEQFNVGTPVPLDEAEPGDLIFWANQTEGVHHVAIYIGNGLVIAAPYTGQVVRVEPLYYKNQIAGVRRLVGS